MPAMIRVMILSKDGYSLQKTYSIRLKDRDKEVLKLEKIYDDVGIDNEGDIVCWP